MKKIILPLLTGFAMLPLLSAEVNVTRKVETQTDTGTVRKEIKIQFPQGAISYRGQGREGEPGEVEDLRFGLEFQRPPKSNGGWDLWQFLRVQLAPANGTPFSPLSRYLLEDAYVLEDEDRTMLEFVWPMKEEGGRLLVTTVQYPSQPGWLFVRVRVESPVLGFSSLSVNAFPGNTAGPAERERWLATSDSNVKLSRQPTPLPPEESALVFYNSYAQENSGCQLIVDPAPLRSIQVRGEYAVSAAFAFSPDQTELRMALGGFVERSPEEVIRVFRMEEAANVRRFMETIDWTPKLDLERQQALLEEVEALVSGRGDAGLNERFAGLKTRYEQGRSGNRAEEILEAARGLATLKEELVAERLKELK